MLHRNNANEFDGKRAIDIFPFGYKVTKFTLLLAGKKKLSGIVTWLKKNQSVFHENPKEEKLTNSVPQEILREIFSFLPIRDLQTVAVVCNTWKICAYQVAERKEQDNPAKNFLNILMDKISKLSNTPHTGFQKLLETKKSITQKEIEEHLKKLPAEGLNPIFLSFTGPQKSPFFYRFALLSPAILQYTTELIEKKKIIYVAIERKSDINYLGKALC